MDLHRVVIIGAASTDWRADRQSSPARAAASGEATCAAIRIREGARVLVVGRSKGNIAETADMIRATGAVADSFMADVATEQGTASAVARCLELYGALDIFYANAGCTDKNVALQDQTIQEWEEVFRGNVITSFLAVKHASAPMVARALWGSIILMSSSGSLRANGGTLAYSACKAAVNSLMQGESRECAERHQCTGQCHFVGIGGNQDDPRDLRSGQGEGRRG